jgi:hypothetical protein
MSDLELETNPTLDLVNALQGGNFNSAEELFNDILGDKVQQSLDAEKVAVADQIFNGIDPVEMEMEDEEVDAILDNEVEEEEFTAEVE